MTELYLDNKAVVLPSNLEFKLYYDNPYFTSTSTHSLDIELPMPVNYHIFGMLNRLDVEKKSVTLKAHLIAEGRVLLNGTALILSVTDKSVKIQLMSGNAELNFLTKGDIYINETNWGNVDGISYDKNVDFAGCDSRNSVYTYIKIGDTTDNFIILTPTGYVRDASGSHIQYLSSPLPYLTTFIEMIMTYFGYQIKKNYIADTWMRHIFCVGGASRTRSKAQYLQKHPEPWGLMPHWKVSEFLDYLEDFAGVIVKVDENTREVSIVDVNEYFKDEVFYIQDIIDEYETEISQETSNVDNITVGNTGYDLPSETDNGYNRLSAEVINSTLSYDGDSYANVYSRWSSDSEAVRVKRIYHANGRSYITYDGELREVDLYGDLMRNPEDEKIDNSLKFVPANIEKVDVGLWEVGERTSRKKVAELWLNVPVSYYDSCPGKNEIQNIQQYIEGNESLERKSDKDKMELAIYTGMKSVDCGSYGKIKFPSPFMDYQQLADGQTETNEEYSLSLKNLCENSMGARHQSLRTIKSDVTYNISFKSDVVPDIDKTFVIANKKYFAKRIEVTVKLTGISPVMTGGFYRLEL